MTVVEELIKCGISGVRWQSRWIITGNRKDLFRRILAVVVGQYPGVFKAAVMINPVTSLGEFATSDLPDFEIGGGVGKSYFHALKARGVAVEMLVFAGEGHDIEGVEAIKVTFESILDWFKVHRAGDD
ncbi:hypothetical protein JVT61DRAFT_4828 [Boletus reticuloceps]|uniref:Uncharacterized protein n=1 Tax=Boletus reticuloceps TaxID=495285 RepID=A0A8I3A753_9AGAM|nr:hypothetical protein JVT61DRAFT_4828 [Boletus reticuloceps]